MIGIDITKKDVRCKWCIRLHPIEYLNINDTVSVGYRCLTFHKKKAKGYYYIEKYPFINGLRIPIININCELKQIRVNTFEHRPLPKTPKIVTVQDELF